MFQATVTALCLSITASCKNPKSNKPALPSNAVPAFVLHQLGQMPDYLRLPIRLLTLAFNLFGILMGGLPFHKQKRAAQQRQVQFWKQSSIGPFQDFIRLYESLIKLAMYSEIYGHTITIGHHQPR